MYSIDRAIMSHEYKLKQVVLKYLYLAKDSIVIVRDEVA